MHHGVIPSALISPARGRARIAPALMALAALIATAPSTTRAEVINITSFSLPGTVRTTIQDVNNVGQIVGDFRSAPGRFIEPFIHDLNTGTTTTFTIPDSTNIVAAGINDLGHVVGLFRSATDNTLVRGFLNDGSTISVIQVPGSPNTYPIRIRNDGLIVGRFDDAGGFRQGFFYDGTTFTPYAVPGALSTEIDAITSTGTFIGNYRDASGRSLGFIDDGTTFTTLAVPGAGGFTNAFDINESGLIIGSFVDSLNRTLGFAYLGGRYTTFGVSNPGGGLFDTYALGVNDFGKIVGFYFDENGVQRGFTAQFIPEPSSLALAGMGGLGMIGLAMRRRRSALRRSATA
jgi:hypothetical protein